MSREDELLREVEALRHRLSRLSAASLRINASLDFDTVLQGVLDAARSLTGARYGVIILLDDAARLQDILFSGITEQEARHLQELPDGDQIFEYLSRLSKPLRLPDLFGHLRSLGMSELQPPVTVSPRGLFPGGTGPPPSVSGSATSSLARRNAGGSSPKRMRRPWCCLRPRRRW